ncbi:MAG: class I SAM-dependent methyltransferase [Pseudomonadota bacterium]
MAHTKTVKDLIYPETVVTGFSRVDGTVHFYQQINALIEPHHTVLDIGAGRGRAHHDDIVAYRRGLRNMKGKCAKVIGVDVDPAIDQNPSLDEALILENGVFPIADSSVDIAFSDWTLEHIPDPLQFSNEVYRVLKPGGWLCARTPNKYGYIALASRLIPESLHKAVLGWAQPDRKEEDVFPTHYLLNTNRQLRRYFARSRWELYTYTHTSEPAYFGNSYHLWQVARTMFWLTPPFLGPVLMIFIRKCD